ncbi:DUF4856 domain-containing protein [Marinomonas aquiplantarum]|uniref:Uncharacterized protein DUF4856 n=1 Tax=Marinomonas aquiplantarum TaxID=491951 RepID=A0A366D920_9GAMM|nr:DUF4856 domain-containing protein [Marinomonas aquiplantarum]RBO85954.1 uncharacterized protein DUF4856 [Marinomonas aquiplantarum]
MKNKWVLSLLMVSMAGATQAAESTYEFGITLKDYQGDKTSSVSYGGQIARHALHNSIKVLSKQGNGKDNQALLDELNLYFSGTAAGRDIIDPVSNQGFAIKQSEIDELSSGKDLATSAYKGVVTGWPGNMTAAEVLNSMIVQAAKTKGGFDPVNGYDYIQLISKFSMGAVFYNKAVNHYLDEKLGADVHPNDKAYKDGVAYTGKEHVWDEAFGYFGAPIHALNLTPKEVVDITKMKPEVFAKADYNKDGVVDLKSEMAFAHAYYAASVDASGGTQYFHTIMKAFYDGRKLIQDAQGEALSSAERQTLRGYAKVIADNWQKVIAEAAFKYAGSVYKDIETLQKAEKSNGDIAKPYRNYVKHWGELKGFTLSLQAAGRELGETQVQLNRLTGFSPVLFGDSQVVAVGADGAFIQGKSISMNEYKLNMLKLQVHLAEKFALKAKLNDRTAGISDLMENLNTGVSAEND